MAIRPVGGRITSQEINDNLSYLDSEKASKDDLASTIKGPTETHETLSELQNLYPNGADGVHLVLDNGHIYVWQDSAWADAGPYQAVEVDDNSITHDKLGRDYAVAGYLTDNTYNLDSIIDEGNYMVNSAVINNPFGTGCTMAVSRHLTGEGNLVWTVQDCVAYGESDRGRRAWRLLLINQSTLAITYASDWFFNDDSPIVTHDDLDPNYAIASYLPDESYDLDFLWEQDNHMINGSVRNNPFPGYGSLVRVNKFKTSGTQPLTWISQKAIVFNSGPHRGKVAERFLNVNETTREISYKSEWTDSIQEPVKILTIGNSFGLDATKYIHRLAESADINVKVGCLYISGGYLEDHYNNITTNANPYAFYRRYYVDGTITEDSAANYSVDDALGLEEWDYVFFNQASAESGVYSSFQPYLNDVVAYVKNNQPNIKIVLMPTWAYSSDFDDSRFDNYNRDQIEMYNAILDAYKSAMNDVEFDKIIPSGTAIQNARTDGYMMGIERELTRDGYHLSDTGCFIAGMTLFRALVDSYAEIDYIPSTVDKRAAFFGDVAVNNAMINPFKLNEIY